MNKSYLLFIGIKNEKQDILRFLNEIIFSFDIKEDDNHLIVEYNSSDKELEYEALRAYMYDMCSSFKVYVSGNVSNEEFENQVEYVSNALNDSKHMILRERELLCSSINLDSSLFKKSILGKYANDQEMLSTLKGFAENDLNVSRAAKEMYLHRNTLINRLDRFYEATGYDLRVFKDAYIVYSIIK